MNLACWGYSAFCVSSTTPSVIRHAFITESTGVLQEILIALHLTTYKLKEETSLIVPLYAFQSFCTSSGASCRRRIQLGKQRHFANLKEDISNSVFKKVFLSLLHKYIFIVPFHTKMFTIKMMSASKRYLTLSTWNIRSE